MKNYRISEILYGLIAVIATYESFNNGMITAKRPIFSLDLLFYQYLWDYLEDTIEKSLIKGEIPLNDHL